MRNQRDPYQRRRSRNATSSPWDYYGRGTHRRTSTNSRSTSRLSRRQQMLFVLGLMSLLAVWFLTPLSYWIVSAILLSVPIEADVELGYEALRTLPYKPVPDRWGVEQIGWDLVQHALEDTELYKQQQDWSFGVVHADFCNAFALPGGAIRVTDKLLRSLQLSQAELAALLGHEMGHVLHRHAQARIIEQHLLSLVLKALVYEDHDEYRETFGEAVGELMLKSARWLGKQKFSRRDDYQADETAWKLLVASEKYDPRGMESLLSKLWSLEGGKSSGETSWESTHPGTKDRISALQVKWEQLPRSRQRRLERYPVY